MRTNQHVVAGAVAALLLASVSCGQRKTDSEASSASTWAGGPDTASLETVPGGGDQRVASGEMPSTGALPSPTPYAIPDTGSASRQSPPVSGSREEIRAQLMAEAQRLNQAVRSRQLSLAAASSMRVRDLTVALGGRTAGLSKDKLVQIEHDVSTITQITENLRLQAEAGKLDGVKAQNDLLQPTVARIARLTR